MRSHYEIEEQILQKIKDTPELSEKLTSKSKTALWRLWVYITSYALWLHEGIVEKNARNSRAHTLLWYRDQALKYIDGLPLSWSDEGFFSYDTKAMDDEELNKRALIKRCAALEGAFSQIIIKIAAEKGPLSDEQSLRFAQYMNQIKDAGNRLEIVNKEPDKLKIDMRIYVDRSLVNSEGADQRTNEKLIEKAVRDYFNHLEFNGAMSKTYLLDFVKKAPGVKIPLIKNLEWRYGDKPWKAIEEIVVPEAGYFKIDSLSVTYPDYEEMV